MARYTGGSKVPGGYYWNTRSWAVEVISAGGGRLMDLEGARYVRVPFPLLFVVVPVLGGLFLMFLPLIGFALLASAVWKKATAVFHRGATDLASTVAPGSFSAGEAYFAGKPGEKPARKEEGAAEAPRASELDKLEREIAHRKGEPR